MMLLCVLDCIWPIRWSILFFALLVTSSVWLRLAVLAGESQTRHGGSDVWSMEGPYITTQGFERD